MKENDAGLYDSHPPLKQRVEALERMQGNRVEEHIEPAIHLLQHVEKLEILLAVRGHKKWHIGVQDFKV